MRELKFKIYDKNDTKSIIGPFAWNKLPQFLFPENFTVLQYTGLKDKNGKDIYEGDIVSGKYCHSSDVKNVVKYYDGAFNISSEYWQKDSLIVLGNIFENPELIQ